MTKQPTIRSKAQQAFNTFLLDNKKINFMVVGCDDDDEYPDETTHDHPKHLFLMLGDHCRGISGTVIELLDLVESMLVEKKEMYEKLKRKLGES